MVAEGMYWEMEARSQYWTSHRYATDLVNTLSSHDKHFLRQASTRHDAAQVFNVGVSDQQFCESTIGQDAGATMGAHLNPVAAFVDDAATTILFLIGSKNSRKSQFLKKAYLPFLANELFACIADKSQQLSGQEHYQSNVTLTSFEILDEVSAAPLSVLYT